MVPIPVTGPAPCLAHLRLHSPSRSPLPKAAPSRPRGSISLNQPPLPPRAFLSRAVLCPPPDRSASCRHSCSSASASGPAESRSAAGVARSSAPSGAARCSFCLHRASGAAEARQRRNPSSPHQTLDVARDSGSTFRAPHNAGLLHRHLFR